MPKRKTTRNAQGGGTIRQRKNGRWEARYTIGRSPGTGKQIQKSIYGDTQAEVRKKLAQATAAIDEGIYLEPSKLTVGAWLDIWLTEYANNAVKPSTLYSYKGQCNNHIKPAIGAKKLAELTPYIIQTFYNDLQNRKGLSAKSIKNVHGVLHKALEQALINEYLHRNPSDACSLPKIIKKNVNPLQDNDISVFLSAIKGHKLETLFMIDLFTGMRQGEILGLKWACVDFKAGTILIDKQLQRDKATGTYYFTSNKNDKARIITPAPSVMKSLREHKNDQNKIRLHVGEVWENTGLVFTNESGRHLLHSTVSKSFKRVLKSIELPHIRFHDLRHSYAVAALQSGDDVKTVQENLGHHTAAFTLDVYE